ncbi:MAG: hypothetical protein ISF22_00480 [Methanomassiliicoccus sp.]|nr:hypothetical protein [Methanomassiliicoccus sp.]
MKVIGVMTRDFRFFHELVRLMREHRDQFVSLDPEDDVPDNVGVVITTREERPKVRFRKVVSADRPDIALEMARSRLSGRESFRNLVAGVDPGRRPGLAILGDGRVLVAETVGSPERVSDEIDRFRRCFPHERLIARVGHGDRTNRNRVIRAIWNSVDDVEVVDETSTTRRTEEPDADAAVSIAMSSGYRMPFPPEVLPTPGEIRDIQRLSRIASEGRVTISSDLAEAVAKGEISLPEALTVQGRKSSR